MRHDRAIPSQVEVERWALLARIENWLEIPMLVAGLVWLVLLVIEVVRGLSPFLETLTITIWGMFVVEFVTRLALSPRKLHYLGSNWLTVLSLVAPALRVLRIARAVTALRTVRVTRGLRLLRVLGSVNRGMRALGASLGRRGFAYVAGLTIVVLVAGSAGMYAFEHGGARNDAFRGYGTALWWTAMVLTTMGSDYWPRSAEGRLLCLLLSLYGFAVFGYFTAALASFFVSRDAEADGSGVSGTDIAALRREMEELRSELQQGRGKVNR